jgi:hypothetical protein
MAYSSIEELQLLVDNQIEESTTLEYKSSFAKQKPSWKEELAKDVSAMANSNGGTIIYGIREKDGVNGHSIPEKLLPINNSDMSKDQLSQLLSANIQPVIEGLEIIFIPADDQSGFYVVNVPKGQTAHQNRICHIYYMRRSATIEAMEDYQIRDVMNRNKTPIIDIEFSLLKIVNKVTEQTLPMFMAKSGENKTYQEYEYLLKYRPVNKGEVYSKYINYFIYIPKILIDNSEKEYDEEDDYVIIYDDNLVRDVTAIHGMQKEYGTARYDPLLPGMYGNRRKVKLTFENVESVDDLQPIKLEVHADNSPTRIMFVDWNDIDFDEQEKIIVRGPFPTLNIPGY